MNNTSIMNRLNTLAELKKNSKRVMYIECRVISHPTNEIASRYELHGISEEFILLNKFIRSNHISMIYPSRCRDLIFEPFPHLVGASRCGSEHLQSHFEVRKLYMLAKVHLAHTSSPKDFDNLVVTY